MGRRKRQAIPTVCEMSIQQGPDGRPGLVLQFEWGFVVILTPESAENFADAVIDMAGELREAIGARN